MVRDYAVQQTKVGTPEALQIERGLQVKDGAFAAAIGKHGRGEMPGGATRGWDEIEERPFPAGSAGGKAHRTNFFFVDIRGLVFLKEKSQPVLQLWHPHSSQGDRERRAAATAKIFRGLSCRLRGHPHLGGFTDGHPRHNGTILSRVIGPVTPLTISSHAKTQIHPNGAWRQRNLWSAARRFV
jgi:hypothetical protein